MVKVTVSQKYNFARVSEWKIRTPKKSVRDENLEQTFGYEFS